MDSSTLSNEVLCLLLAQNNLPITGSRENLLERLNSIPTGVSQIPERRENPPRTRRSDQRQPAPKRARSTTSTTVQPAQTSSRPDPEEISVLQDESADHSDSSGPSSSTIQDGGVQEERGVPRSTTALAQMIASIVDDKLQSFGTNRLSPLASSQPACQPERLSNPPFEQQLSDPSFVSSLLTQPTSGNLSTPPSSCSPSPIAAHVPHKTRQAILNGEFVEFDSLLPENSSLVDHDLPGISIQFEGKHVNIPTPSRKKKTYIDTIDRWLSAFAVYYTVFLTSFPHRAVEMFAYQEIIRSAHRKFAGFAWLSYDIDFRRKAACSPSINWGERDIQLYLLKFTGQAKSCCTICGSGDHLSHGCSLSALRPTSVLCGVCNNYNRGLRCSQDPCPFSHRCKTCNGEHPASSHN